MPAAAVVAKEFGAYGDSRGQPDESEAGAMSILNKVAIDYLRAGGCEVRFPDGTTILRRGEAGEAFYVVLSGAVEVMLVSEGGRRLPLARLGAGATFGEMSLVTGQPVSADVIARGNVTLLVYSGEHFQTALAECVELRNYILVRLCDDLRRTSSQAWSFFQRAEALRTLVHASGRSEPLVAETHRMRAVQEFISESARGLAPILITGPPGAGKVFVARKIHEAADSSDTSLLIVDCPLAGQAEVGKLLFGSAEDRHFGESESVGDLQRFGALDLADGGTLVLRHVEALDEPSQKTLSRYLTALSEDSGRVWPRVRVIATTCADLRSLAEAGRINFNLVRNLSAWTLEMPALAERKRDILPLANLFLQQLDRQANDGTYRFNRSAEHAIISAQYRYRNVAELREAVDMAALFADGAEIGSEHVFTGSKDETASVAYDLGRTGIVHWLISGGLTILQAVPIAIFIPITILCLVAPHTSAGQIANGLVWGLWWPALMVLFLFVGRAWCTVCPISLAGNTVRRLVNLRLSPPEWMKKYTVWFMLALFLLLVWTEHFFEMTRRPFPTGLLLLALMAAASSFCLIYQRNAWCRYLCPLGSLGAGYSVAAIMRVRANPGVCAAQCRTHECFKGGVGAQGCPVFHHPMYVRNAQHCKLCLSCLRVCPHGSVKLYVQPPLLGIWRLDHFGDKLAVFALGVFFLALVMLASHKLAWLARPVPFTVAVLVAVGLGVVGMWVLEWLLRARAAPEVPTLAAPVAFALLVLASGPLMAFHLENVPKLPGLLIHSGTGSLIAGRFLPEIPLLFVMQSATIVLSAMLAAVAFWRTRVHLFHRGFDVTPWRWRVVWGMWAIYSLVAFALVML